MDGFWVSLKILAIAKVWILNGSATDMNTKAFEVQGHLNFPSLHVKNVKSGRWHEIYVCVCTNIVINYKWGSLTQGGKTQIKSTKLWYNCNHLEGVNRWLANLMVNKCGIKIIYAN